VGVISQSGAIAEELIGASNRFNIPIGAVVSVGNAMHFGVTEYLQALGRDERCEVILLYAESFGDEERFLRVAQEVSRRKPIVTLLGGRTPPGVAAAFRHTGSRAMGDDEAEAFCRNAGLIRVKSLRDMQLAATGFGRFPKGIGRRVLLLSNSGGPGVLAADEATTRGLDLVALPERFAQRLREAFPAEAVVANPLDLLADARDDRFALTLQAALQEGTQAFDAILMIHVIPFMVDAAAVVARLAGIAKDAKMPIMHSMMGTLEGKSEWFAKLEAAGVSTFDNVEDMAACAGLLASRF